MMQYIFQHTQMPKQLAALNVSFICRRDPHSRKTTNLIFIVIILDIIKSIIQLFHVYFLIQSSNIHIRSKLQDLNKITHTNSPTDRRRSWGQSKEVATTGPHHECQTIQGSSPGLSTIPVTATLTEGRETHWAKGLSIGHIIGFEHLLQSSQSTALQQKELS